MSAAVASTLDVGHAGCRDVLKMAAERMSWEVTLNSGGSVVWADVESDGADRLKRLRRNDWLSWIPGVQDACGKVALSDALQLKGASFWPRSWRVPQVGIQDIAREVFSTDRNATLIVKPDQGSQGSGISLAQSTQELQRAIQTLPPQGAIVQEYISRPLLLDGFKWDARIYVLMMPLPQGGYAAFLEQQGLVRVCTQAYDAPTAQNLQQSMVHLTNYSLNKFSQEYVHSDNPADATRGCKRTLSAVLQRLESTRTVSAHDVWASLAILSRQTIDVIQEHLRAQEQEGPLQRCFHLVGLDVLLDEVGKAWLLEANYRPSMLVDEIHGMAGSQSRTEINRLFAGQKRTSGPKWGRPCRCSLYPSLHEHQLCAVDVAVKLPAVEGALTIVQRARAGNRVEEWSDGTVYRLV